MSRILVNGVEQSSEFVGEHWGELLERLDRQCAGRGQVLTAVRFDGVDQPSFCDPTLVSMDLTALAVIEADSASPRDLLEASVNEAITAARTLTSGAERVGGAFRGFEVSNAQHDLAELAQGMGTLVAVAQAMSQAIGIDLKTVSCQHGSGAAMIDQLIAHTDVLIDSQEAEDWITVADVIEYDIAPSVGQWPALFEALLAAVPIQAGASSDERP